MNFSYGNRVLKTELQRFLTRNEIANGMVRNQTLGKGVSNAVAEGINNKLKTLKKLSNGLTNFDRFRKRELLIFSYYPSLGTQIFVHKWR